MNNGLFKQVSLWVVFAVIVILIVVKFAQITSKPPGFGQKDFLAHVEAGNIHDPVRVTVGEDIVRVHARFKAPVNDAGLSELTFEYPEFRQEWEFLLAAQGVSVEYARENTMLPSMIFQIVLLVIIISAFWYFMLRQLQRTQERDGGMRTLTSERGEKSILWDDVPRGPAAEAIADAIDENGRAILAGVIFHFDGSAIRSESRNILEATASFLKARPCGAFYVVGHMGPKDAMDTQLSAARAQAVVDTLVEDFGVDPERLEAHGVGPLVPVCKNATDIGRARNCRVELVER